MTDPLIIPYQEPIHGLVKHEGQTFEVSQHYAQGKDMKGLNFTHMMFNEKGAFGLVAK